MPVSTKGRHSIDVEINAEFFGYTYVLQIKIVFSKSDTRILGFLSESKASQP